MGVSLSGSRHGQHYTRHLLPPWRVCLPVSRWFTLLIILLLVTGLRRSGAADTWGGAPWVEDAASCERVSSDEYRAFCKLAYPGAVAARARRADFERRLRSCTWAPSPSIRYADGVTLPNHGVVHELPSLRSWPNRRPPAQPDDYEPGAPVRQWTCLDTDVGAAREQRTDTAGWLFAKVGPVVTRGGWGWSEVSYNVAHAALPALAYVTSSFLGSMDDSSGQLLDHPPLHQHHHHLVQAGAPRGQLQLFLHSDCACTREGGGVGCHIRDMPPGYAMPLRTPLQGWAELNDVRPAGSAPLSTYVLAAVRWARPRPPVPHLVSVLKVGVRADMWGAAQGYQSTFPVPGDRPTHMWTAFSLPRMEARVAWSFWHVHPYWTRRLLLVFGLRPNQLGLLEPGMPRYHELVPGKGDDVHAALVKKAVAAARWRERAQNSARSALGRSGKPLIPVRVCLYDVDLAAFDSAPDAGAEFDPTHLYRRYSACQPFNLSAEFKTPAVMFAQYAPSSERVKLPTAYQHSHVLLSVVHGNEGKAEVREADAVPHGYRPFYSISSLRSLASAPSSASPAGASAAPATTR